MRLNVIWKRLTGNFTDPVMRANVLALVVGKAIGLTLLLTGPSHMAAAAQTSPLRV